MYSREGVSRRQALTLLASAALPLAAARPAAAQDTLDTVKVLLGVPAGSAIDASARRLAEALKKGYAGNTVVENRTGASGIIGVQGAKNSAPDGRTVLVATSSSMTLYPLTYKKLPYDPVKDLIPVSTLTVFDLGFAVGPMVPREVNTLKEYFAWCKANPDKASFGSPGAGSTPHFQGLMIAREAGADALQHVPYRGPSAAVNEMVGGTISAVMVPLSDVLEFAAAGKCRILAVTGEARSRFAPKVPTFHELGLGEYGMRTWIGVFLPAGTPAPLVQRLGATMKTALADKATVAAIEGTAQEVLWCTPQELRARMEAERVKWAQAVKALNFTPES